MINRPLVSVITPTTHARLEYNERIRHIFAMQDYPNKEHVFDYGEGNTGEKRNRCCDMAIGSIILHMDSDDLYASDWISKSVDALLKSHKQLTGLSSFNFHNIDTDRYFNYTYQKVENMAGATLCYYKSFWEGNKFMPVGVGEDVHFVRGKDYFAHDYIDGFLATIHKANTCPKNTTGECWQEVEKSQIKRVS